MAIEYRAVERSNPQDRTKKQFYATAIKTGDTSLKQLCEEIEQISALSKADVYGVLYALLEVLPRHLADGKSIHLGELGSFRIGLNSNGEPSADKVDVHSIKHARVIFSAGRELANSVKELKYRKID